MVSRREGVLGHCDAFVSLVIEGSEIVSYLAFCDIEHLSLNCRNYGAVYLYPIP